MPHAAVARMVSGNGILYPPVRHTLPYRVAEEYYQVFTLSGEAGSCWAMRNAN